MEVVAIKVANFPEDDVCRVYPNCPGQLDYSVRFIRI
jgi:hypothetical protein